MEMETNWSFVMADRLRSLRESKKLSHEKLSKSIFEKYGIKISSDSLMNYEVSREEHSKKYKNLGMRVEYLYCLADFYGVSTDWILGISDVQSPDAELQAVVEYTGIPEDAIKAFQRCAEMNNLLSKEHNAQIRKAVEDGAAKENKELNELDIEDIYNSITQQYASIFDMIVEFMRYSSPASLKWMYLRDMATAHFNFVSLQQECSDRSEWYGNPEKYKLEYALFRCQQSYIEYCKQLARDE